MTAEQVQAAQMVIWDLIEAHKKEKQERMRELNTDTDPFPLSKRQRLFKLYDCYDVLQNIKEEIQKA